MEALEISAPQTQTSLTWTSNLTAGQTYSFYVYAIDAAGNKSKNSNTVTVTLPVDNPPPTQRQRQRQRQRQPRRRRPLWSP